MKKLFYSSFFLLFFIQSGLVAQNETVDLSMVYKIKKEGTQNSTIGDLSFWMTDYLGPRLAGSKASDRANDWAKKKME